MDPEETLEGSPSEATPLEEEEAAPGEETEETGEETPEAEVPAEETPATEPTLYELPDGRKVDADTLSREWKDNFMPEFTKRSQKLAELTTPAATPEKTDPLKDPNYIPPTYDELAAQIEARILGGMTARQAEADARRQSLEDTAVAQLAEVKAADPGVNEALLFQHAMKYGFQDLRVAHQNMADMTGMVKKAQTMTKDNAAARVDPVSAKPGASGVKLDPDSFSSSVDYLRALKAAG